MSYQEKTLTDPAALVERFDSQARRSETPCGDGSLVWRVDRRPPGCSASRTRAPPGPRRRGRPGLAPPPETATARVAAPEERRGARGCAPPQPRSPHALERSEDRLPCALHPVAECTA